MWRSALLPSPYCETSLEYMFLSYLSPLIKKNPKLSEYREISGIFLSPSIGQEDALDGSNVSPVARRQKSFGRFYVFIHLEIRTWSYFGKSLSQIFI